MENESTWIALQVLTGTDDTPGRATVGASAGPSLQSLNDLKRAESLLIEGRMLGIKAFAVATTMCLSGAVLVVGATRWALDVDTVCDR